MMSSEEVRSSFLEFFREKGHTIVPSAPVIPHGDPTLLFTNAGMNQFKDVFLGTGTRPYTRAADTQKCIRVSGKHNDLEEVGYDTYHHTFFEMLGNWSFGDYYKEEAIAYAWELLVDRWKLPVERLHATVFRTDDEAYQIWLRYLPPERIHRFDEKDNFWEMGDTGPCGPSTEIHFDRTPDLSGAALVNAGTPDVIEIWNLVFIQFNRLPDGTLQPLQKKHVDTGMGLERIVAILQDKWSNYDTDLFQPLIRTLEELSGRPYPADPEQLLHPDGVAMRVIADHVRALSFAIADGALPGNEGRGYVLRRILRRAARYARNLGFHTPVIYQLVPVLVDKMGKVFPELQEQQSTIERTIRSEEEMFLATLDRGIAHFETVVAQLEKEGKKVIPGEAAFLLYDTFGFPLDLTQLMARERGLSVDTERFEQLMQEQRERSRQARKVEQVEVITPQDTAESEFIGYETLEGESCIVWVEDNKVALAATPFYAEAGGQVADTGTLEIEGERYRVKDVQRVGNLIVHFVDRPVTASAGARVLAKVDARRRQEIRTHHSATHILHEALRRVLGSHVKQAGSLVAPDHLRFDFSHYEKLTPEQLREIEEIVNEKIRENIEVYTEVMPLEKAQKIPNVKMFFGDKYGDIVRVVFIDEKFSVELCGGTHVGRTPEIGLVKIVEESSVAAGVRRVVAVSSEAAEAYMRQLEDQLKQAAERERDLMEKIRKLEKQLENFKVEAMKRQLEEATAQSQPVDGIRVVTRIFEDATVDQLKQLADFFRAAVKKQGIVLLATIRKDKVQLVCAVTDDLRERLPAGTLVREVARQLGGGGGGQSHMATAGGRDVASLPAVLEAFPALVQSKLETPASS